MPGARENAAVEPQRNCIPRAEVPVSADRSSITAVGVAEGQVTGWRSRRRLRRKNSSLTLLPWLTRALQLDLIRRNRADVCPGGFCTKFARGGYYACVVRCRFCVRCVPVRSFRRHPLRSRSPRQLCHSRDTGRLAGCRPARTWPASPSCSATARATSSPRPATSRRPSTSSGRTRRCSAGSPSGDYTLTATARDGAGEPLGAPVEQRLHAGGRRRLRRLPRAGRGIPPAGDIGGDGNVAALGRRHRRPFRSIRRLGDQARARRRTSIRRRRRQRRLCRLRRRDGASILEFTITVPEAGAVRHRLRLRARRNTPRPSLQPVDGAHGQ